MRCSSSRQRRPVLSRSSAASRRWANSSTPKTARICSPATSAPTNIIRIEEKKDGRSYAERSDPALYRQDEERALAQAIDTAKEEAAAAVAREDFEAAMRAMAKLRPHVDAFFDKVTVNVADGADKEKLRENRLKLLNEIREATRAVADFSRIEG